MQLRLRLPKGPPHKRENRIRHEDMGRRSEADFQVWDATPVTLPLWDDFVRKATYELQYRRAEQ